MGARKMIDVCLINLPKPYLKEPLAQQPLGLLYIASALREKNKTVLFENYAEYTHNQIFDQLPEACLYGITATSLEIPEANKISHIIKAKYPESKIAIGGPGTLADEYIDRSAVDYVNHGEGERTIFNILDDAKEGKLAGDYLGHDENIDQIPVPSRDLLEYQGGNIFAYGKKYKRGQSTIIIFSRGCPYKCAFCSAPALHTKLRYRSPEKVAAEIQHVKDYYDIHQFRFSDDMFTSNKKKVRELCEHIGPLDVAWRVSCRVKPLDRKTLELMYQAGCKELSFGIESFDNAVLKGLNKGTTAYDNIKALEMAKKVGFDTRILFMIRTPFQTRETIDVNMFYVERVPYDIIAVTAFIPIPGCDVWYHPDKYNIEILDRDLEKYNFYMYGNEGRRKIEPIIKIKDRTLDEFHKESEEFRDYVESKGKVNKG